MKKIAIIFFAILSSSPFLTAQISPTNIKKLTQTFYAIENFYVDTVNQNNLVDNAIVGVLESLDPHSVYIPAKEVERANEPIKGSFDGIGVQFQIQKDTLLVVNTLPNCPAEKVGIRMGDRFLRVDSTPIAGVKMPSSSIMKLLRGKSGSKVRIEVFRQNEKKNIEFVVTRDKIPLYSIEAAYVIAPKVGYIKINSFALTTMAEFYKALEDLQKEKIESLIIDLQSNGGGVMDAAIDITSQFLPKNKEVLHTKGAHLPRIDYFSQPNGEFIEGKVVVLIDEYSASASEIVAGALQDWDRAVVVGRRSFGKGLVQRPLKMIDGSEIRLTVAKYYTPSGRNIQKPYSGGSEKYFKELLARKKHGELQFTDSIHFPDSLKFKTLNVGRTVYGGGGIMPDVFVPIDTNKFTDFHISIIAKGIFNEILTDYLEKNRENIKKRYSNFDVYNSAYQVPESVLNDMLVKAKEEKIEYKQEEYTRSKSFITMQFKASIARNIYKSGDFYKIMNTLNPIVIKGLEVVGETDKYLSAKI